MNYFIQSSAQLSAHLRALRRAKGLNQTQLGALLGVGQTRIARIERDPASVSADQLIKLLAALGARMALVDSTQDTDSSSTPNSAEW